MFLNCNKGKQLLDEQGVKDEDMMTWYHRIMTADLISYLISYAFIILSVTTVCVFTLYITNIACVSYFNNVIIISNFTCFYFFLMLLQGYNCVGMKMCWKPRSQRF